MIYVRSREAVLLPWIETPAGQTVEELLTSRLGGVSRASTRSDADSNRPTTASALAREKETKR